MNIAVRRDSETFRAKARTARITALEETVTGIEECGGDPAAYIAIAQQQCTLGLHEDAIRTFQLGVEQCPPSVSLYRRYIVLLKELNRTTEAIQVARDARRQFPAEFLFQLKEGLTLPLLYKDSDEIEAYRNRFEVALREIAGSVNLETRDAVESADLANWPLLARLRNAALAIGQHVNFLLAYQGRDDRELQALWGGMAHRIMAAYRPQWAETLAMPPDTGKLRIGYISAHLRQHSVAKTHLAWVTEQTQERFEVFAYYTGKTPDARTEDARRGGANFRHLPHDFDETCRSILADDLHVLVFLDIGLDGRMTQLAALRLAPVQCTTWGHPMTSGLPTIDYFLSSELMEPDCGQSFYTEKLVCLPGIGVRYPQPVIPCALFYKTRADFGIRNDEVVYLSCQSPCKYLPQDDDIYPAIARLVPNAQFVFIARNDALGKDFQARLENAFGAANVDAGGRLVFVPHLDQLSYWNLNALSDICLDTMGWSGCNTTLEAIACGLPVVTLPGQFMRGRHSFAILTQLGIVDTIARDKSHYVEIAVGLGLDPMWRRDVVQRLAENGSKIYSDKRSIPALESFYESVIRGHS